MDHWPNYFFQSHSEDTLRNWARRLRIFRYFRAYGGHANDSDSLLAAFQYRSIEELVAFFCLLEIPLVHHSLPPPQPVPGATYRNDEMARFPSLIPGSTWLEQPGHGVIGGKNAFLWCTQREIQIVLSDGYAVTEATVSQAEAIEEILAIASLEKIDPPLDNKHCLCPKYYPQYFH
jgi:hypothetical protein